MNDSVLAKTLEENHRVHGIMTKSRLKFAVEWKQMEGKPAPPFTLPTLDGQKISLADLRGKVVVLDFWFRACGPCMVAMPEIQQLADDFKGRPVVFLGMNIDENPADARLVVDTMRLSYPTLRISQETASELYKVQGYPTVMLIDPQGVIRRIPMTVNHDALKKEIESMIPQK
jgi:thiol-disulfide isomerase/thioredoxin